MVERCRVERHASVIRNHPNTPLRSSSSIGRAFDCQSKGSGFETRLGRQYKYEYHPTDIYMKLAEIAQQDFFDHDDPAQKKMMAELDHYTASPNIRLKPETIKFLSSKYAGRDGSVVLYRAMVFDDIDDIEEMFGVAEEGASFTYKRDKESSWTKSKRFAYGFAENGDLDEQYTLVLKTKVDVKDFLLDVDDLSKNDRKEIILEDQSEVIVNAKDRSVVIDKIIDNHE
jgi:hypothetical protein